MEVTDNVRIAAAFVAALVGWESSNEQDEPCGRRLSQGLVTHIEARLGQGALGGLEFALETIVRRPETVAGRHESAQLSMLESSERQARQFQELGLLLMDVGLVLSDAGAGVLEALGNARALKPPEVRCARCGAVIDGEPRYYVGEDTPRPLCSQACASAPEVA